LEVDNNVVRIEDERNFYDFWDVIDKSGKEEWSKCWALWDGV